MPTSSGGGGEKPPRRPGKGKRPPASARFDHLAGLIHLLKVLMLKGVFGSVVHLHGKEFDDIYRHIFSHCSREGSFSGMLGGPMPLFFKGTSRVQGDVGGSYGR